MNKVDLDLDYILDLYLSDQIEIDMETQLRAFTMGIDFSKFDVMKNNEDVKIALKILKMSLIFEKGMDMILKEFKNGNN